MTPIRITLEWFLNPDHLPMIAGIQTGSYQKAGLEVEIIEPTEHYDGFSALETGEIDLHTNEPLHLFEHYSPNLRALGCFFETDGGVLMRKSSMAKLHHNQKIRICTPAAEPKTNRIGFEILKRYADKQGFALDFENVEFVQADFHHVHNLQNDDSLDGAWLCFYNFEGVEAEQQNFDFVFIDQKMSPYPNFSALEFITSTQVLAKKSEAIQTFINITSEMTKHCQDNPQLAKQYYYEYTKTDTDALMNAIIEDTLPRLVTPIKADSNRWLDVREMMAELDIARLTDDEYLSLW